MIKKFTTKLNTKFWRIKSIKLSESITSENISHFLENINLFDQQDMQQLVNYSEQIDTLINYTFKDIKNQKEDLELLKKALLITLIATPLFVNVFVPITLTSVFVGLIFTTKKAIEQKEEIKFKFLKIKDCIEKYRPQIDNYRDYYISKMNYPKYFNKEYNDMIDLISTLNPAERKEALEELKALIYSQKSRDNYQLFISLEKLKVKIKKKEVADHLYYRFAKQDNHYQALQKIDFMDSNNILDFNQVAMIFYHINKIKDPINQQRMSQYLAQTCLDIMASNSFAFDALKNILPYIKTQLRAILQESLKDNTKYQNLINEALDEESYFIKSIEIYQSQNQFQRTLKLG